MHIFCKNEQKYPIITENTRKGSTGFNPVLPIKIRSDIEEKFPEEGALFVFDSGSHISIISWIEAEEMGLKLDGDTWFPLEIQGVGGIIPALRRAVQIKLYDFPPIIIPLHVSKNIPKGWRILGLEKITEVFSFAIHNNHTYIFLREDIEEI